MKKCLIFNVSLLLCIISGCAVAPTTPSSDRSEKRADKRAEVLRAKISSQNEAVVAGADNSEKRVDNVRSRRGNVQRPAPTANDRGAGSSATQKPSATDDINPAQTSDDPTFGRTKENPVKLGSASGELRQHVTSSYVYIKQLRDKARLPFKYNRTGSVGPGDDGHIIDLYKLTDSAGTDFDLYIDMYHPDKNPLDCMAPKGMFISQ